MSLRASATVNVNATPQVVLEFVLDVDRYRQADHKILRVSSMVGPGEDGKGSIRVWGRLPGLPIAPDRQDFTLERWSKLTFVGAPRQLGRLVFNFIGTFECVPLDEQNTKVTHAYEFTFCKPFTWIEARIAEPLRVELDHEVRRLAELVGGGKPKTPDVASRD